MQIPADIYQYMNLHATELGERILSSYPALHGADDDLSPLLSRMLRRPYPAQALAIMGVSKRWQLARNANVVAECGAGQIVMGTDWPFPWTTTAVDHILNAPALSADEKRAMLGGTAAKLLGIDSKQS